MFQIHKKYFKNSKVFLSKQLKEFGLFNKVCKENDHIEILRFILYQSPFNDNEIMNLIESTILINNKYGLLYNSDYLHLN